jgi:hypothetical protein
VLYNRKKLKKVALLRLGLLILEASLLYMEGLAWVRLVSP